MTDSTPLTFVTDPSLLSKAPVSTGTLVYRSAGHCLVIGSLEAALEAIALLPSLSCTVVSIDETVLVTDKRLLDTGVTVFTAQRLDVSGHLGAYTVRASSAEASLDLGVAVWLEEGRFDTVLDLGDVPVLSRLLPPPGYVHVGPVELSDACYELDQLVGEFEKPRYFDYRESLCAHSRSTLSGCTRCIDVCVAGAISSAGEGVSVDPYLCQGCGSCATLCPSGAMSYAYPTVAAAVSRTREHRREWPQADTLMLHTLEHETVVANAIADLENPGTVLALAVEEVSAFGIDFWLTILTGGVGRILLVTDAAQDDPNRLALGEQVELLEQLLTGLGMDGAGIPLLALVTSGGVSDGLRELPVNSALAQAAPSGHAVHGDKRAIVRAALDVLAERHIPQMPAVTLSASAPFGRIRVDTEACTLCMACVSTCPAGSLLDGQDTPALRQIEANCVQCGLCESACPERAIELQPRYLWDSVASRRTETLHEEAPFHCVRCHKAFATQRMIDTMTEKLAGHWMFGDEKAIRRLKMCEDCRVKDMFEADASGIDVRKTTPSA